jgi:N-acylneuraminate cytidylyltransferase
MNATGVILARAGSKGVPNKNVRLLAGRPCIEWTIDAARNAERVSTNAVSTDDAEGIGAIGARAGCIVIDRPPSLATDTARIDDAARHAIEALEAEGRRNPADPIVILYANVPVRPPDLIDRALALLADAACDSVQSYAPVGKNHPWWTAYLDADSRVQPWEGDVLNHNVFRRQDLPPALIPDAGVVALTRPALFLERAGDASPHAFLGRDPRAIVTGEGEVVDIDTEIDFIVADAILSRRAGAIAAHADTFKFTATSGETKQHVRR